MPREVHIDSPPAPAEAGVVVGGVRVPVITGPAGGGDVIYVDPRSHEYPLEELNCLRGVLRLPVLAECRDGTDCALTAPYASGLVVDACRLEDASLLEAVAQCGIPVVVRREVGTALDRWLGAADRCAAAGTGAVILCEGGGEAAAAGASKTRTADSRAQPTAPDLSLLQRVRKCSDAPVLVDVGAAGELVGAAVTAGADGVVLAADTTAACAAEAAELVATLAPFGRAVAPDTLDGTREAIDQVDACLAGLLERRVALAGLVQRLKPVGGYAGRDPEREHDLVTAMARRAPHLGLPRLRRIMAEVIEAGLDIAESEPDSAGREEQAGGHARHQLGNLESSNPPGCVADDDARPAR